MKNIIFYFSGTGNCLAVARQIAGELGDTEIAAISKGMQIPAELAYERVGIVFPVYYWLPPTAVTRFVESLRLSESQYVFAVATYAAMAGTSLAQIGASVAKSGGKLSAAFAVSMPGNYIANYGAFPAPLQRWMLGGAKKKTARISRQILEKQQTKIPAGSRIAQRLEQQNLQSLAGLQTVAVNFSVAGSCTSCGSCAKVCPVGNIRMENGRPVWGAACEQCVACIQWCPARAIEYGDKTAARTRYHHPQVALKEMFVNP